METATPLEQYAAFDFANDDEYQGTSASSSFTRAAWTVSSQEVSLQTTPQRRSDRKYFVGRAYSISIGAFGLFSIAALTPARVTEQELSIDAVREYELSLSEAPPQEAQNTSSIPSADNDTDSEPVVLSFTQLKALIEAGKEDEIPNNKVIPDGLNEQPPSISSAAAKKKPWEISAENVLIDKGQ
ncbi:hypothetical protein MIND_01203400 [Mycena indigotica]|uniref:Peroxisomal membrane protein PEX14-like KPWE domain-containing protein n=1 Tax=Mycena indigotica TaxID=2126181 RepID=A0A8H6S6C9_9AGAR|nr:uncharacterized protein MIND_01203400 [Mycena indigotica]KAF7293040.1 hypothetical protein MIND_01203400 [Mycena indigotica]